MTEPIITNVVETDGDNEATDTITAQWTGTTFVNGVAGEPIPGSAADAPYTVGLFEEEAPMFVDRNHQWNGATTAIPLPRYLVGGEYIMSGNDNRDNPTYQLEITISQESYVYMLVDDRMGDGSNANPPNFPDWLGDRTGDGVPDMAWLLEQGWEPVKTGLNRFGNPDWPDHVGADEGADGVGPGVAINQWSSVYVKRIPAGTFTIFQPDNNGQNMYGVVVKAVPQAPTVTSANGNLFGFTFEITDGLQTAVNPDSITATLDGNAVSPLDVSKTDNVTTVVYAPTEPLASESTHTAVLSFADNSTPPVTDMETLTFTVERYVTVQPSWAADVDTSKAGILVRTHQLEDRRHILGDRGTRIPPAEEQLAGRVGENVADPTPFTENGYFVEETYINYNQDAFSRDDPSSSVGNFGAATDPAKFEHPIPGIPGTSLVADTDDHAAVEALAYLDLPAGFVRFGVNSDDGFRLTVSPAGALADKFGEMVIQFDGGRGAADTTGRLRVLEAGRYAMRLMWYEGTGGFNCEWFTVQADGTRVLVNDPAETSAVKAYYARTGPEPTHVSVLDPFPFGSTLALAFPDDPIHVEITDGATAVQQGSIGLKVNGQTTSPAITQADGKTTIELAPPDGIWPAGNLDVELTYTHNPTETHAWSVPILNYVTLAECLRTAVGTGQEPGMRWRTHQWDRTGTRANTVAAAEAQLANEANSANLDDFNYTRDGDYFLIDYVNFEQGGLPDGMIHDNQPEPRNAFELFIPGIPGLGAVGDPDDNTVGECLTFLEFPAPGLYYMGVNRDDGFLLTVATSEGGRDLVAGPNLQQIGIYDGGGGIDDNNVANNNLLAVHVPQAGVWPFRLLWFEGNGGASVEWYQTDQRIVTGLINDTFHTDTLRGFRSRTATPPAPDDALCAGGAEPTIAVARTETGITLTFEGALEQADDVAGPYSAVTGATSPHTVTADQARKFYRASQ